MNIIICDDETVVAETLKNQIGSVLRKFVPDYWIDVFCDSAAVSSGSKRYDLAFLDVEIGNDSGLDIARHLKEKKPHIIVFIITAYDRYMDDALDLNVFRFLSKPVDPERLKNGIIKAIARYDNTVIKLPVKDGNAEICIEVNDILYAESANHNIRVVTANSVYISPSNMDYWSNRLNKSFFCRVHHSFIVNMNGICAYKRDEVRMVNGDVIPVAFRKRTEFRKIYNRFMGEQ